MTQKDYQKGVCLFEPDPSVRERVRAAAERERKPQRVSPLRTALIAACVCLTLLGTAVGARIMSVRMTQDENGVVWISGDITYYPLEDLSDSLKQTDGQDFRSPLFDTWEETEEYIGLDIMKNPVLDAVPESRFVVSSDGDLKSIYITGHFDETSQIELELYASVFTDRFEPSQEDWNERFLGIPGLRQSQTGRESYTTSSGLEAEVLVVDSGDNFTCFGALSLKGVPFVVVTHSDNSIDDAREVLLQVLDGFTLE